MKITIVGVGNVGSAIGADLSRKGHHITLLKTSKLSHNEHFNYLTKNKKISVIDPYIGEYTSDIAEITTNYEDAISSAEVIIFVVQTNYHNKIIKKISPYIQDNQVIVFEPGYLSTAYLLKYCKKKFISIEAESSPIDCRIIEPGKVQVIFKNVMNPFGVYPKLKVGTAEKVLNQLGFPYRVSESVIEAALHNPNLIVHTVGAIFSIPRIEYTHGNYWMYKEVFTPSVWNVCESLDNEKIKILNCIGIKNKRLYVEACQERNFIDDQRDPLESFFDYAYNSSPKGPDIVNSRYITEDVSQGLVLLESLGKVLDVPTPTATGLINIANASLNTNFRIKGRNVESIGYKNLLEIIKDNT